MYPPDFNNKTLRAFAITTDRFGIDPLLDQVVFKLRNITRYVNHQVNQAERGAPDLISFNEYQTEDYWWHIMCYNGICQRIEIVENITLRIPDVGALIEITNSIPQNNAIKTLDSITII